MGNLIQARTRVTWGKVNLSSYDGEGDFPQGNPLIYDPEVSIQSETEGPTASMKWDPSSQGFALYETFLKSPEYMATPIIVEFFYPNGKTIPFKFVWSGQSIVYGNDMSITVKMQSELAGLINANIRSIAQVDTTNKGISALSAVEDLKKKYGLDKFENLVVFNEVAEKDMKKAKIETNYANDQTFGSALSNIAKQTGNMAFANNIGEANIIIFPPFTWDPAAEVFNGATDIPVGEFPSPSKRYGYLVGPSMYSNVTRTSEWKPPQQTNEKTPRSQVKATPNPDNYGANTQTVPSAQQQATSATLTPTRAPIGVSGNRSSPGVGNKDNPDQVPKQNALNEEKSATLNFSTYLVPVLVGIKPHDIIYLPSFKGDYIEDWIVQSVDYDQNNGKVEVSIQATRVYGLASAMNDTQAQKFQKIATSLNLVGPNWSLEAWEKYAWQSGLPPSG